MIKTAIYSYRNLQEIVIFSEISYVTPCRTRDPIPHRRINCVMNFTCKHIDIVIVIVNRQLIN